MKQLLLSCSVLLLAACANNPEWDYDKSINFSKYKTFAFVESSNVTTEANSYKVNPIVEKSLRESVAKNLSKQGFTMVTPEQADVLINYHASVETKIEINKINTNTVTHNSGLASNEYYKLDTNWTHSNSEGGTGHSNRKYDLGTLVLDIVDREQNTLVWRGAKERRLKADQSPEQRADVVNDTVAQILMNFPPQS